MYTLMLLLIAFYVTTITAQGGIFSPDSVCLSRRKIDLGFLIDASGSLRYHFEREKKLVLLIHNVLTENVKDIHMAAAIFSDDAIHKCPLKYSKYFAYCVDRLKLIDRITRIDKALKIARDDMFLLKNHHRPGALKVVIIMTDGDQTNIRGAESPAKITHELREMGIIVIIIGILQIDRRVLNGMDAGNGLLFYGGILNIADMEVLSSTIQKSVCKIPWRQPIPTCERHVDIIFVVDSSGSLRGFFNAELYFVKAVAEAFEIDKLHSMVAVVRFSHTASTEIHFSEFNNIHDFEDATKKIHYDGGKTRIDLGLLKAEEEMMLKHHQTRMNDPNVLKFVVLITDGQQEGGVPALIADRLRIRGIKLVVIGVGQKINHGDMQNLAGIGNKWYSYHNFDELIDPRTIRLLKNVTCTGY